MGIFDFFKKDKNQKNSEMSNSKSHQIQFARLVQKLNDI